MNSLFSLWLQYIKVYFVKLMAGLSLYVQLISNPESIQSEFQTPLLIEVESTFTGIVNFGKFFVYVNYY